MPNATGSALGSRLRLWLGRSAEPVPRGREQAVVLGSCIRRKRSWVSKICLGQSMELESQLMLWPRQTKAGIVAGEAGRAVVGT